MRKALFLLCVLLSAFGVSAQGLNEGALYASSKDGKNLGVCPLKTTTVRTDISGFVARVRVRQEFENTHTDPIHAVYTFPLSQNGAVDDMTMTIGTRVVRGKIMKREEARQIYESAKSEGKTASLLDQERPNIFTQSVANIMPGEKIVVEISYVETLIYEDGGYEFVFPMTVGPRYTPASVTDGPKTSPATAKVRPGHDISIEVNLNAGVPVEEIRSTSHQIQQINHTPSTAKITLKSETTIPNKDFVLRYDVTGKKIEDAVLATRDARGGFFTMVLQPPDKFTSADVTPKEIVFVLDTSGSMSGFPIEKAKEAMKLSLDGLHPNDTFNLITFAGDTEILFERPVPATQGNLERAHAFLESRTGEGGTEMMKAIKAALDPSGSTSHLRIACFMTDGYVNNEEQIIAEIQRHPKARVFSFGIGNSVNRHLLDKMAEVGNGEVDYVALGDDGSKAARKFYERVRTPLLTDISIDWNGMPIGDVYPAKLPDLFSAKPVIVSGRYAKGGSGVIRLKGKIAGQEYSREITMNLPEAEPANDVLATLWARKRIDELTAMRSVTPGSAEKMASEITQLGLEFRILTENTSFVAVEERVVNHDGKAVTIQVPAAVPEGVDPSVSAATVDVVASSNVNMSVAVMSSQNVQGLYTVSPTVARSGLRNPNAKKKLRKSSGTGSGSGSGTGVGYGSGNGLGSGSGSGSGPGTSSLSVAGASGPEQGPVIVATTESSSSMRERKRKDRLHTWVYALIERIAKKGPISANEQQFVKDGHAHLRLKLSARSSKLIEKLRAAGFEIVSEKQDVVTGKIQIEKLAALIDMDEIILIMPSV